MDLRSIDTCYCMDIHQSLNDESEAAAAAAAVVVAGRCWR